ncbi:hypothetical protein O7626_37630 [Micromonospora sp. WMMD1102]|uniref:hypothetical protein n=1 Tax=Micromonospora sp. WMMD1102 TaxID=3016105 RepID=UPI0024155C66|nr:hypothetical protein [Micromonospora sp. WMMD1102]MDG4791554.1 hypothetical protein [Micromonospora sp. WMMD1102]
MAGVSIDAPAPTWPGQPDPPAPPRWRRWLFVGPVGWAVLLLALTAVSVYRDEPTVKEQRTVEQAGPVVDRALGQLVAAAGPDVAVQIAERRVTDGCELTVVRDGASLDATVVMHAPDADVPALLDRIADRLPAAYRAVVRHSADGSVHALRADAGEFVAVDGGQAGPGVVELTVSTGCRPVSGEPQIRSGPLLLPAAEPDPLRLLGALGATEPTPVGLVAAPCPGQGTTWTARATGRGTPAGPLSAALPRPAGAVVVADGTEMYAYRSGPTSVLVESGAGQIRVAVSTGCAG